MAAKRSKSGNSKHAKGLAVVKSLLQLTGDNPKREGLQETPGRVLKAFEEWFSGYHKDPALVFKTFQDGAENYDQLVFLGNIPVYSFCEHHMALIWGVCHVGYIPSGKIIGLSKLPRLVEIFSRRLTVQERMTTQIADAINKHLQPHAVGVVMRCRHACMESRGINKHGIITDTLALHGAFLEEPSAKAEFISRVQTADQKSQF